MLMNAHTHTHQFRGWPLMFLISCFDEKLLIVTQPNILFFFMISTFISCLGNFFPTLQWWRCCPVCSYFQSCNLSGIDFCIWYELALRFIFLSLWYLADPKLLLKWSPFSFTYRATLLQIRCYKNYGLISELFTVPLIYFPSLHQCYLTYLL